MSALVAFAPVRLSVFNSEKTSVPSGSLFAIIDERVPTDIKTALEREGFEVKTLPSYEKLPSPISSHTDMLIFKHGDFVIAGRDYLKKHPDVKEFLESAGIFIHSSDAKIAPVYPYDARFNALIVKDRLFCKIDTVAEDILRYADSSGIKAVPVKQGYPACTTLMLSENIAVTTDRGMANALRGENIDVLLVPECDAIKLPPYKNGFIGGCAGRFRDKIYFLGDTSLLPYRDELNEAAKKAGVKLVSLAEGSPLVDLGGILFFEK